MRGRKKRGGERRKGEREGEPGEGEKEERERGRVSWVRERKKKGIYFAWGQFMTMKLSTSSGCLWTTRL